MIEITLDRGGLVFPAVMLNPEDEDYYYSSPYREAGLYEIQSGAIGTLHVFMWASSFEDALERAAEYFAEHAPGHLTAPAYDEAAEELGAPEDWADEEWQEQVREAAEADLTYTESGWLVSYEWCGDGPITGADLDTIKAAIAAAREAE